jgi:hypothetical protein
MADAEEWSTTRWLSAIGETNEMRAAYVEARILEEEAYEALLIVRRTQAQA